MTLVTGSWPALVLLWQAGYLEQIVPGPGIFQRVQYSVPAPTLGGIQGALSMLGLHR